MPVYQIIILIFFPHCIKNIMNFPNWLKDPEISFVKRQLRGTKRSKHSQLSEISHGGLGESQLKLNTITSPLTS